MWWPLIYISSLKPLTNIQANLLKSTAKFRPERPGALNIKSFYEDIIQN